MFNKMTYFHLYLCKCNIIHTFLIIMIMMQLFWANEFFFLQEPVRSAIIDSSIRVTDNGRESINRKVRSMGILVIHFWDNIDDSFSAAYIANCFIILIFIINLFDICRCSLFSQHIMPPIKGITLRCVNKTELDINFLTN